jgi:hypothetical protein
MPLTETPAQARAIAPAASSVAESRSGHFMAGLMTLMVWMGGNVLLSAALFAVPALCGIRAIWRLFVLIFAARQMHAAYRAVALNDRPWIKDARSVLRHHHDLSR